MSRAEHKAPSSALTMPSHAPPSWDPLTKHTPTKPSATPAQRDHGTASPSQRGDNNNTKNGAVAVSAAAVCL